MRILMIAPQPFFQPRGTPFSVLHRLKALSKLGYEVELLTYHLGEDVEIKGVRIHRIPAIPFITKIAIGPSFSKILLDIFVFVKAYNLLKHDSFDLLHTHEEAGFFGTSLAGKFGLLHLYDMHSSLPQQLSNFKFSRSSLLLKLFERLEAGTIDNADSVITICPELFNYVEQKFPGKRNTLIENVADNSLVFESGKEMPAIRQQLGINGETVVLYTGTFEAYQGIDLLVDACAQVMTNVQNLRFVLVGGKPEQVETYRRKVADLRMEEFFVFTGSVQPYEIPSYVEACDILVSPRVSGTNTPLKIYSYLRSGKPIVATDHVTHTQVLDRDVAVLTECTPEAFGRGVLKVLNDRELGNNLAARAQRLAEEKYSYESYLERTGKVYGELEAMLSKRNR